MSKEIIDKLEDLADSMHCCTLKEVSTPVEQVLSWKMKARELVKELKDQMTMKSEQRAIALKVAIERVRPVTAEDRKKMEEAARNPKNNRIFPVIEEISIKTEK